MKDGGSQAGEGEEPERGQREEAVVADEQMQGVLAARLLRVGPVDAVFSLTGRRRLPVAAFVGVPGAAELRLHRPPVADGLLVRVEERGAEDEARRHEKEQCLAG